MWAHVPVLVNEQRKKLSKRRDKVALEQYRDEGYLADAMVNYLMTLGWSPAGETEIVPWSQIEAAFRLEDVNQSPAFFDLKKLAAFNGEYIRTLSVDEFVAAASRGCRRNGTGQCSRDRPARPDPRRHARRRRAEVDFLFLPDPVIDEGVGEGDGDRVRGPLLRDLVDAYASVEWSPPS